MCIKHYLYSFCSFIDFQNSLPMNKRFYQMSFIAIAEWRWISVLSFYRFNLYSKFSFIKNQFVEFDQYFLFHTADNNSCFEYVFTAVGAPNLRNQAIWIMNKTRFAVSLIVFFLSRFLRIRTLWFICHWFNTRFEISPNFSGNGS